MAIIEVRNLKKYYQIHKKDPGLLGSLKSLVARKYEDVKAVDNISFSIKEGELVGFIGPNGAGKTTTLKCLSGLLCPTEGTVTVLGFNPWQRKEEYLKQISLVMGQKNQLWWDLPAIESFILNKEIYEIPQVQFKRTLDELVRLLEVEDILKIQVRNLSLGQRMKCELIAALLHNPKVLFLDEPTIGLDVIMQKKIRDFIKEYNGHFNSTIILTSHYMDDVKELCQRIIIIDKGKVIFDGRLAEIVEKFASHKILSVVFSKEFDLKKLDEIGEIKEIDFPHVKIMVQREASNLAAAELLQHFPVADLNIEEIPIDDVIRQVFTGVKTK
jgi:ABC-2 type transport system ATP-binding protein